MQELVAGDNFDWLEYVFEANTKEDVKSPVDRNQLPKSVRISLKDRTCGGMFYYLFYKLFRVLYVAIWFYISPFLAISFQFLVPIA